MNWDKLAGALGYCFRFGFILYCAHSYFQGWDVAFLIFFLAVTFEESKSK